MIIDNVKAQQVLPSGCIIWTGALNKYGYGVVTYGGRAMGAHRLAFFQSYGAIGDGMHICHRCDVRSCINPEHLFAGTARDNVLDMHKKGRAKPPHGDSHWNVRLSELQRVQVIALGPNRTQRSLAAEFGVSAATINRVLKANQVALYGKETMR